MDLKLAIAIAVVGGVTLYATMPVAAATRSRTEAVSAASGTGEVRTRSTQSRRASSGQRGQSGTAAGSFAAGPGARAPGSLQINANGLPYRVPEDCAYPREYGSSGVAIFQRFGCRLP